MRITHLGLIVVIFALVFAGGYSYVLLTKEQKQPSREPGVRMVLLFYYDPTRDQDADGNILCTEQGLVAVPRTVASYTPIEDSIRLLLAGSLTEQERSSGITTEYPLAGVSVSSVALNGEGELRIELRDPENRTSGGSCRVAVLWAQIRATALQFPEVRSVSFQPEDLFQP